MLSFYVLLLVNKLNPWMAMAGAIGFAFSTYFIFNCYNVRYIYFKAY